MMRTTSQGVFVLVAILACAFLVLAGGVDAFRQQQSPAIITQQHSQILSADASTDFLNRIRGGASDDSDDEETDDEEEEGPSLAKSAKAAATKAVKSKIKSAIAPKPKKKSLGFFKLPYILKACLNPLVFWKMTAGYWKSLYNIDYMAQNVSMIIWLIFPSSFNGTK